MNNPDFNIKKEYLKAKEFCDVIECQKVIFEPSTRKEWFFEEGSWAYFEFNCDDKVYLLRTQEEKNFSSDCYIKDMSFEIKMLLSYVRLRNVVTIEKDFFNIYLTSYEKEKKIYPEITVEKFNLDLKLKEEKALVKSEKIANGIMCGCLILAGAIGLLFVVAIVSYIKLHFFA